MNPRVWRRAILHLHVTLICFAGSSSALHSHYLWRVLRFALLLTLTIKPRSAFSSREPVFAETTGALSGAQGPSASRRGLYPLDHGFLESALGLARCTGDRQARYLAEWHRKGFRLFWRLKSRPIGRPSLPRDLQRLIRKMASENPAWGEERIANELKLKLGTHSTQVYG